MKTDKSLEESLIKHAECRHYPIFENGFETCYKKSLIPCKFTKFNIPCRSCFSNLNRLENLSLPNLKILKVRRVESKFLTNLISNTKGHLSEIIIIIPYCNEILIQAI